MLAYYGNPISPNQIETGEGFLICKNVPIARTGKMEYRNDELQIDGHPDGVSEIMRHEEDVFDPAAVASCEGKPVTDEHPPENLEPETAAAYTKGHVQNVRRVGENLVADLHIFDANLINDIRNEVKREVSCGYTCEFVPDGTGLKQINIRGNHVAVVRRGRAGHEVAIKDAKAKEEKGAGKMGNFKKELLNLFGASAQGASAEELDVMAGTTSAILDAFPEEKDEKEQKEQKDVMVERAPKGDDLGSKLDRVLELLEEVLKKEDEEEKKLSDESDLDKEIKRLEGQEGEEAVTVPAGELDDACVKTGDSMNADFLRKVRPAVASIKDPAERARVVDALLSGTRNDMGGIFKATQDAAKAQGRNRRTQAEICEEQKKAYDAFNPHKKKD